MNHLIRHSRFSKKKCPFYYLEQRFMNAEPEANNFSAARCARCGGARAKILAFLNSLRNFEQTELKIIFYYPEPI